jgi:single-strand DNA-binding protein
MAYSQNGVAYCNFTIAVTEKYKKENGDIVESTAFVKCTAYRHLAETIAKYCKKGDRILVEGKLATNAWVDKNGNKRVDLYVKIDKFLFMQNKNCDNQQEAQKNNNTYNQQQSQQNTQQRQKSDLTEEAKKIVGDDLPDDDEIPF